MRDSPPVTFAGKNIIMKNNTPLRIDYQLAAAFRAETKVQNLRAFARNTIL